MLSNHLRFTKILCKLNLTLVRIKHTIPAYLLKWDTLFLEKLPNSVVIIRSEHPDKVEPVGEV